jgi:hypothetical protein
VTELLTVTFHVSVSCHRNRVRGLLHPFLPLLQGVTGAKVSLLKHITALRVESVIVNVHIVVIIFNVTIYFVTKLCIKLVYSFSAQLLSKNGILEHFLVPTFIIIVVVTYALTAS